jgi:LTXXQ motif family protein
MRGHKILLIALLAATTALPEAAHAQFSPRGVVGTVTMPLRAMLGRFGHFPRSRRSHMGQERMGQERMAQDMRRPDQPAAQLGDVGPIGWPSAYEDVLGFTFWPGRYVGQVRAHGFDVITAAMTGAARGPELARTATTGAAVQSDSNVSSVSACNENADVRADWPASQIEQFTQLNSVQRDALGKLQAALAESVKTIKAACRDVSALPPTERIKASVQELWAVRDAGIYVRAPLKAFDETLTDAQKAGFAWKQPADNPRQAGKAASSGMARQYQACATPGLAASERLLGQIEQDVRPSNEQAASMQALRKTSSDMAKLLTAPCAQPIPADPVARLDAANDQLASMSFAATSMEIALDSFSAQLGAEQKTKFDSLAH